MNATNQFFVWFFTGMNGLGGWFFFMILAAAAVVWLLYDTQNRRIPALGWKTGVFLLALLILPAIVYRFSGAETQLSLDPFVEAIFYLGLLGGLLPVILDVGYFVSFQGMVGCPQGHLYDAKLGECPVCNRARQPINPPVPVVVAPPPMKPIVEPAPVEQPKVEFKKKAMGWLVSSDQRVSFQLNHGDTTIGRSADNDFQISGETTVSRFHAKIREQNGHFHLSDLGSTAGTKINQRPVNGRIKLEQNDEICFGEAVYRFTTIR